MACGAGVSTSPSSYIIAAAAVRTVCVSCWSARRWRGSAAGWRREGTSSDAVSTRRNGCGSSARRRSRSVAALHLEIEVIVRIFS